MLVDAIRTIFLTCFIYVSIESNVPEKLREYHNKYYGGRKQYFTILSLYATIFTIVIGMVGRKINSPSLKMIFEICLSLSFIAQTIVTLLFWILYFTNQELLFAKELMAEDMRSSLPTEIIFHLLPAIILAIESYITPIKRNVQQKLIAYLFSFKYLIWLYFLAYKNNKWPYPFLENRNDVVRIGIFILITTIGLVISEFFLYVIDAIRVYGKDKK